MRKILPALLLLLVFATGCSSVSTAPDQVALHYKGGSFSSQTFEACIPGSTKDYGGPGDKMIVFPTNQRSYDATGGEGAERGPFTVVSDDSAELNVPVSVTFTLKTDCETLRKFHEHVANKHKAAIDEKGTPTAGWTNMLHFIIGKPLDVTLDTLARGYTWREIWNDEEVRVEFQNAINERLPAMVADRTSVEGEPTEFFVDFNALVQKPDPVDDGLKAAIIAEQKAVAEARAQETAAEAQKAVAEAQADVEEAKAKGRIAAARADAISKEALIAPYGSADAYNKAQAVENGINPWQPTYIVPGSVTPPTESGK